MASSTTITAATATAATTTIPPPSATSALPSPSTATLAAAGYHDKRRATNAAKLRLQTPASGTFPSELPSPMGGDPAPRSALQPLHDSKTPVSPPSAYIEFLRAWSPTAGLQRSLHPASARAPPLRIPQSPFSPSISPANSVPTYSAAPLSAAPWSAHPHHFTSYSFPPPPSSSIPTSTPHTPSDELPATLVPATLVPAKQSRVTLRRSITRTVTYSRATPLDPAPRGKRRKLDQLARPSTSRSLSSSSSTTAASTATASSTAAEQDPVVKPEPAPQEPPVDTKATPALSVQSPSSSPPSPPVAQPSEDADPEVTETST